MIDYRYYSPKDTTFLHFHRWLAREDPDREALAVFDLIDGEWVPAVDRRILIEY